MTFDMFLVYLLLAAAIPLFAWERVSFDVTALVIMSALMLSGILTPAEGLSGFSNEATVTIAAMFVLTEGLKRAGGLSLAAGWFQRVGTGGGSRGILTMMGSVAVISAFINNTAAVAIFIPIVITVAERRDMSPSRLLMPLSFAAMLGGVCTLVGTSTNILVSSIAADSGLEAFGMFEFAPLGLVLLAVGFLYLFTIGRRLIPDRRPDRDMTDRFDMQPYLTDVEVQPGSSYVGRILEASELFRGEDLDVVGIFPEGSREVMEPGSHTVQPGDVLRVRGPAHQIARLQQEEGLEIKPSREWYDIDLDTAQTKLVEAVVAPDSAMESVRIRACDFPGRFGAVVLAIRHHGQVLQEDLGGIRLSGGDAVLLSVERDRVEELGADPSIVLASEVEVVRYRTGRLPLAVGVLVAVVGAAALDLLPIAVSAVTGSVVMLISGILTTEEAYEAVNWKIIFLLAGVLPLGAALEVTGAAGQISDGLLEVAGQLGPAAVLGGYFLISMLLTNVISNQATAALLAPVAIQTAATLGVSARPLLMAVTFAASLSFMTPVGYQTNTLVYGAGHYRFTDFLRAGAPLDAVFLLLAILLIPVIW
ncbi:MAG: SLC13 family permease, partial [bacterium]